MWYRRLLYVLVLAGAVLFQITNENYLARFLLAVCIALPLLSLALSLPGMVKCRVELFPQPAALNRGEAGAWTIGVSVFAGLPLARLTMRVTVRNLFTGEWECRWVKLTGVAKRRPLGLPARTAHCGVLELRVEKIRVYDYLGLVALPLVPPHPARLLCRPIPAAARPPAIPEGLGKPAPKSAARRGPGEDYDLRDYRPGDPMRSVHWELSSKWDELIVREASEAAVPLPLLTVDLLGGAGELDRLLDKLLGMSQALLRVQRPHAVLWLDGAGEPRLYGVSDLRGQEVCLRALLGEQAPAAGPRLDSRPELIHGVDGPVFRIHITPEKGGDGHG